MKIAYFGLPLGALLLARTGYSLALVGLSPIEAPGRRRLRRLGARVRTLDLLEGASEADAERALGECSPDLVLCWFWTRRMPENWLSVARLGAFGVHPSLLPRHRGPNPYFAAIDAGDIITGATLHRLEPEYDTGAIIATRRIEIGERNAWQLARALDRPSLALLLEAAERGRTGRLGQGETQDAAIATWAGEPEGSQLQVDWGWPTARVLRRIRALSPVPALALEARGVKFFVTQAVACARPELPLSPGEAAVYGGEVAICTADAAIRVVRATTADGETSLDASGLANLLAGAEPRGSLR